MRLAAVSSLVASVVLSACAAEPRPPAVDAPPKPAACSEDWAPNVAACAVRCDAHDASACYALGWRYAFGRVDRGDVHLDDDTAQTYYAKACAAGSADGCTAYVSNGHAICALENAGGCRKASLSLEAACAAGGATGAPCAALREAVADAAPKICEAGDEEACAAMVAPLGAACAAKNHDACASLRRPAEAQCRRASTAACVAIAAPFASACDAGDASACSAMESAYAEGASHACTGGSVEDCAAACDGKNPAACVELASWYAEGHRVARDPARAVALYRAVCDDTHGRMGCMALGELYLPDCPPTESCIILGGGPRVVPVDGRTALAYLRRACAAGRSDACDEVWTTIANGSARATAEERTAALQDMCERRGGEYGGMLKDAAGR